MPLPPANSHAWRSGSNAQHRVSTHGRLNERETGVEATRETRDERKREGIWEQRGRDGSGFLSLVLSSRRRRRRRLVSPSPALLRFTSCFSPAVDFRRDRERELSSPPSAAASSSPLLSRTIVCLCVSCVKSHSQEATTKYSAPDRIGRKRE